MITRVARAVQAAGRRERDRPRSLRRTLLRRLFMLSVCGIGFVVVRLVMATPMAFEEPRSVTEPQQSEIDRMFEAGQCWSGAAPADVSVPSRVAVTMQEGQAPRLLGEDGVTQALEQIFDGVDHEIYRIHGFCR